MLHEKRQRVSLWHIFTGLTGAEMSQVSGTKLTFAMTIKTGKFDPERPLNTRQQFCLYLTIMPGSPAPEF